MPQAPQAVHCAFAPPPRRQDRAGHHGADRQGGAVQARPRNVRLHRPVPEAGQGHRLAAPEAEDRALAGAGPGRCERGRPYGDLQEQRHHHPPLRWRQSRRHARPAHRRRGDRRGGADQARGVARHHPAGAFRPPGLGHVHRHARGHQPVLRAVLQGRGFA